MDVKPAVMTKDNCHVLYTLWLKPMLLTAEWFDQSKQETVRVADYIEPIADVDLSILNAWGFKPLFADKLELFAPRSLIIVDNALVKKIVFEDTPKTCIKVSAKEALRMLIELRKERPKHSL